MPVPVARGHGRAELRCELLRDLFEDGRRLGADHVAVGDDDALQRITQEFEPGSLGPILVETLKQDFG